MVASITGNGPGLFNASNNILGNAGVLGQGVFGQAGNRGYVNAATGNLILQALDEELSGRGADLLALRTYNSVGQLNDGDGDGWGWDGERTVVFTAGSHGEGPGVGGSVTRTSGDGHQTTYTWDGSRYVSTEGSGAHDTVRFESSTPDGAQWVWTDGTARLEDRYNASTGRLASQKDTSGNLIDFSYPNGRLTSITDRGSGQRIELMYAVVPGTNLTRLSQVNTYALTVDGSGRATAALGTLTKQVDYFYDTSGRLKTVRADLTPLNTLDVLDSSFYRTDYSYDGTSGRIASITQTDGTSVNFTYYPAGNANAGKIWTVTDANGKQTFNYLSSTQTAIVISAADDSNAQTWTYTYDATSKQLLKIESPAVNGQPLSTTFEYEGTADGATHVGNLKRVTDGRGKTVTYGYDDQGNRTLERDSLGDTITRTFDPLTNQVLTETHYKSPDTTPGDNAPPADPLTTHFAYDGQARLRFIVSAEGRVMENRYGSATDGFGLLTRTIQYTANRYTGTDFSEAALAGFVTNLPDKTQAQLMLYSYDLRGNLATRTDFAAVDSNGAGVLDSTDAGKAATVTNYIYDERGSLLSTLAVRGSGRTASTQQTSFLYDGMNRETQRITSSGTQTTLYNGVSYGGDAKTIQVTTAAGLVETRTFDDRGRLVSISQAGSGTTRQTKYFYTAQGQLALTLDAQGGRQFSFYNAAGQLSYQVDSVGEVTGFTYTANGQLLTETHYANRLVGITASVNSNSITNNWLDNATTPTKVKKTSFLVGAAGTSGIDLAIDTVKDRTTTYAYDDAERLITRTDAASVVTTTAYDGASRITTQTTGARVERLFYDADGLLVGRVDALGYLTERKYDAARRLTETIRYTTRSPNFADVSAPVFIGASAQTIVGGRAFQFHIPAFDADGDTLTFSKQGTWPSWLTLDANDTGVTLRGVPPTTATSNNVDVTVRATDGRGGQTDVIVHLTIKNSPPSWVALADQVVASDDATFSVTLPAASDAETAAANLVYSIQGGLPSGLQVDPATPGPGILKLTRVAGTTLTPGTYVIVARVADGTGAQALFTDKSFVLQVTNKGPVWPAIQPPDATRAQAFTFIVPAAVDPEGRSITYTVLQKPSWLSFVASTRTFSGTPPATLPSDSYVPIVIQATDSIGANGTPGESTPLAFSVRIKNAPPTWGDGGPLSIIPNPHSGVAMSYTLPLATDPEGKPILYAAIGLPAGLQFDATSRVISGTTHMRGPATVTVSAADDEGAMISRTLTFTVVNDPPVYTGIGMGPLGDNTFDVDAGAARETVVIPLGMFTDANGDPLTFSLTGNFVAADDVSLGVRMVPGSGSFTITAPTSVNRFNDGKPRTATLTASDGQLSASVQLTFTLHATNTLDAPAQQSFAADTTIALDGGADVDAATTAPTPTDPLADFRPAANADDLHSYVRYDNEGRVVAEVDEQGFLTETTYDEQNNKRQTTRYQTFVTVGANDTLTDLKSRAGAGETTTTQFDALGRVSTITGVDGTLMRNEYDTAGRLTRQIQADGQTNDDGTIATRAARTSYNSYSEVIGTLSGRGDALLLAAHPTPSQADIDAQIAAFGMRYEYDAEGRRTKATDANGHATRFYYDTEDRLTQTVNARGEVSEIEYDAFGEIKTRRLYGARLPNSSDNPLLDQLLAGTKGLADLKAALAALPSEHNEVTGYEYDPRGLLKTTTDALGFVTTSTYDIFGELATQVRTILQAAGGNTAVTTTTEFDYDLDGRLRSTTGDVGGVNFNTQMLYDAYGRVIRSFDAAGKVVKTDYRDSGRAIEVTDALTRRVRTEYDQFARVHKVYDGVQMAIGDASLRKPTVYEYNDTTRTLTVTTPEGVQVTTVKTRTGEILRVIDGRQNALGSNQAAKIYVYNADGQVTRVTDALGNHVDTDYDNSGRVAKITDARGIVTTFGYDAVNRVFERRVDPYNADSNPNGLDLVTSYEFDTASRQITVREGKGNNQGANTLKTTAYHYDTDGRLQQVVVDPDGLALATTYQYDGLGNTVLVSRGTVAQQSQEATRYIFDNLGRRVKEIRAPSDICGAGSARHRDLTTEYRYDSAGRVGRTLDANGQSSWFVYDDAGELKRTINALGEVSDNFYDDNGRLAQTRRYFNRLTAATLASFGDTAIDVAPAVSAKDARNYFVYDKDNHQRFALRAEIANLWSISESILDANGNVIETRAYDKRFDDTIDPRDDISPKPENPRPSPIDTSVAAVPLAAVTAELIALGYKDASGNDVAAKLATVRRTHFAYDKNNRLRFTVDATGAVSEQAYDPAGNIATNVRYATRSTTLTAFDEATIDGAVGAAGRANPENQVSRFVYDTAGRNIYSARAIGLDASGQLKYAVRRQSYDPAGHLTQTTAYAKSVALADGERATFDTAVNASDVANNLQNRTTAFVYDAACRQIYSAQVLVDDQGQVKHVVTQNVYDSMEHIVQSTIYAKALTLADYQKSTLDGEVTKPAVANDAQNRTTAFIYDCVGRQRFVVRADGSFGETVYDALGQVTEQRQFDAFVSPATARTEAELMVRRAARHVGDGVTRGEIYIYDLAGRRLSATDAAGSKESYTYDGLGNRKDLTDKNGKVWTYQEYDRVGRLTAQNAPAAMIQLSSETSPSSRSLKTAMVYNAFGDLTKRTEAVGTAEARATLYGYDLAGNQTVIQLPPVLIQLSNETTPTSKVLTTYIEYNAVGTMKSRTEAFGTTDAQTTTYEYDSLGRRKKVTLPGFYDPTAGKVVKTATTDNFARTLETTYDVFDGALRTKLRTGLSSYQYEYKTFDTMGRATYDVDALTNVTSFLYNSFGDQTVVTRYSKSVGVPTGSDGLWTAADLANLKVSGTSTALLAGDPQSRAIAASYDNAGRKYQVTQSAFKDNYYAGSTATTANAPTVTPPGAAVSPTTQYAFDAFGDAVCESVKIDDVGTDASGRVGHWRDTCHYFDTSGRETTTIDGAGFRTDRTYDAKGNVKTVIEYANAGEPGTLTSLLKGKPPALPSLSNQDRITATTYDVHDRPTIVQRFIYKYSRFNGSTKQYEEVTSTRGSTPLPDPTQLTTVATMTYDTMDHVRTSTDALGNVTITNYNLLGQVTKVTEPARLTAAAGSKDPFLNQVTAAPTTTFTLNASGQSIMQVRSSGGGAGATLTTLTAYDFVGNAIVSADASGQSYSVKTGDTLSGIANVMYGDATLWNLVALANNLGVTQTAALTAGTTLRLPHLKFRQMDYNGRVIKESQTIQTQGIGSDTGGNGQLTSSFPLALTQTLERRYGYDATGRQTEIVDVYRDVHWNSDGSATLTPLQSGTRQVVNAFGEVTEERRLFGAASLSLASLFGVLVTKYDYDTTGHRVTRTSSDGRTQYFYDLAGQLTRQEQRGLAAISSDGTVTSAPRITETGYNIIGQASIQRLSSFMTNRTVASVTNEVSITPITQAFYDRWGNVTTRFQGDFVTQNLDTPYTGERRTTSYEYNTDNKMIAEHAPTVDAYRTDGTHYSANVVHAMRYDVLGRTVADVEFEASDPTHALLVRTKEYNAAGQVVAETDGTHSKGVDLTQALSVNPANSHTGIRTEYVYDAHGNKVGTHNAHGTVFVDTFDSNNNLRTHSVLRIRHSGADDTEYQSAGASAAAGTVAPTATVTREINEYGYDDANRRTADGVVLSDNHLGNQVPTLVFSYTRFDERNLGVAHLNAASVLTRCEYDVFGNQRLELDANGNGQSYNYNTADYSVGRMESTTVSGGNVTSYRYNDIGQVIRENRMSDPTNNYRAYEYFGNGLLKRIEDHFTMGTQGLVGGVDWWSATDVSTYEYNSNMQRASETFSRTGQKETGHYIEIVDQYDSNGNIFLSHLQLDSTNYPVNFTGDESPRRAIQMNYDALGRLTGVEAPANSNPGRASLSLHDYYDELGNRRAIVADHHEHTFIGPSGIPLSTHHDHSEQWYTYDEEGRQTLVNGILENGHIVQGGSGTAVTYDELGRRQAIERYDGPKSTTLPRALIVEDEARPIDSVQITWEQDRFERYSYNDLSYLMQVEQSVTQREKKKVTTYSDLGGSGTQGGSSTTDMAGQQTDFMLAAKHTYDQRGAMLTNTVYADIHFDGDANASIATAELKAATVSTYRNDGLLATQVTAVPGFNQDAFLRNDYDNAGNLNAYLYRPETNINYSDPNHVTNNSIDLNYTYTFSTEFGGYKVKSIAMHATPTVYAYPNEFKGSLPKDNGTDNTYDARGELLQQIIRDVNNVRTLTFSYDNDGHIVSKAEHLEPKGRAAVNGSQDYFYANGRQIASLGSGSLQSAEFSNDFTPVSAAYPRQSPGNYVVRGGDTLMSIARLVFGDEQLWYLIGDANNINVGPNETLSSTEVGKTYVIPNVVANTRNTADTFTPYNSAAIIGAVSAAPPPPANCDRTKQLIVQAVSMVTKWVVTGLLTSADVPLPIAAGLGTAAGDLTGQLAGWGLGLRHNLDFEQIGIDAVEATATAEVGSYAGPLAKAAVGELFHQANTGFKDWGSDNGIEGSFFNLEFALAGGGSDDSFLKKWGGAFSQVANQALNPHSGWAFNDSARNWGKIILDGIDAFGGVAVGGIFEKSKADDQEPNALAQDYARNRGTYNRYLRSLQGSTDGSIAPDANSDADSSSTSQSTSGAGYSFDLPPGFNAQAFADGMSGKGMSTWRIVVPKTLGHSEELGAIAYPDESKENQILGSAAILQLNGAMPRELREGQVLDVLPFDQLDHGKLVSVRQGQNAQEQHDLDVAQMAPAVADMNEHYAGLAREKAARDAAIDAAIASGHGRSYNDAQRQVVAELVAAQPNLAALRAADADYAEWQDEELQRQMDVAKVTAEIYDTSLENVRNGDYKPNVLLRVNPLLQGPAMVFDAIFRTRTSEYARSLQVDLETNRIYGGEGFSSEGKKLIATQVLASASSVNPWSAAAFASYSTGRTISNGIDNGGLTSEEWAGLGAGAVFGGLTAFGLKNYGGVTLASHLPAAFDSAFAKGATLASRLPAAFDSAFGIAEARAATVAAGWNANLVTSPLLALEDGLADAFGAGGRSTSKLVVTYTNTVVRPAFQYASRVGNAIGFTIRIDGSHIEALARDAISQGATEINIGSGVHGAPPDPMAPGNFEITTAADPLTGAKGERFLEEDLETARRLGDWHTHVKFRVYDLADQLEYASFQRQLGRASAGGDVWTISATCYGACLLPNP